MAGIEGLLAGRWLVERYRVDEVIGRGGFAVVYRARDERLGRAVAVKVIMVGAPDAEARDRLRERFHREARAAARLQHPHVVTVYDFGTDPELHLDFLVMELLQGEDLASRRARGGAPPLDEALRILREAADGVGAGHRAGLVHRDVKPGNLFLAEGQGGERVVKVLDFGIARAIAGDQSLTPLTRGAAPLSPAYASPEQLTGGVELTPASDVYGLGVIGYEMLTGERLFAGAAAAGRPETPPPLPPHIPEAVAAVIRAALEHDPARRPANGEQMAQALAAAAAEPRQAPAVATGAPATPPPEPTRYRARRKPRLPRQPTHAVPRAGGAAWRGWAIAAVLAVVAAALVIGFLDGRDHQPEREAMAAAPPADPRPDDAAGALTGVDEETGVGAGPAAAGSTRPAGAAPGGGAPPAVSGGTTAGGGAAGEAAAAPPPAASGVSAPAASPPVVAGGNAVALNREGLERFGRQDYGGAVAHFRRAVALRPDNAYYRNNLGWALFRAGDVQAAARELDEVVRLDPSRDIVHANIGEVRLAQGDTAGAIAAYRRFLELNTDPRRERIARDKLSRIGS